MMCMIASMAEMASESDRIDLQSAQMLILLDITRHGTNSRRSISLGSYRGERGIHCDD